MIVQIKFRRGTAAEWAAANPILGQGEPGWETDALKGKIGDGSTSYTGLAYKLGVGSGAITSVNSQTGVVVLTASDVGAAATSHTHPTTDLTGLTEAVQDIVASTLVAGTNMTVTYNDAGGTITLASSGGGGGGAVTSVAGRTGAVVLTKTDVGLSNNDNTSDANKPVSTAQQTALDGKADLVSGTVPLAQIAKSQSATASTIAQRNSDSTLTVANGTASGHAVTKAQLDAATGTVADIRTQRIASTTLVAADATTWVQIPEFDITGIKTGDIWRLSFEILYDASQTGGIDIRFQTNTPYLTTASWIVTGTYRGLTQSAATQSLDVRQQTTTYPTAHPAGGGSNVSAQFGGTGVGALGRGSLNGEFEVLCNGTALTSQKIGFEFRERSIDATFQTKVLAGSFITAVQVA